MNRRFPEHKRLQVHVLEVKNYYNCRNSTTTNHSMRKEFMETPCPEEKNHISSYRSSFNFMAERENLLKNQAAFQQTLERLHKVVNQIYDLQQEIAFRKADLRALQVKLGGIAVKYGLEPVGPTPVEAENTIPAKAPFSVTS